MPTQVQFRRGTNTQNNTFIGAEGEITIDNTNRSIRVHDGVTEGGSELAKSDLSNHSNVGVLTATGFDGDLTGNADTATALETSRDFSINGDATASAVSFDGTTNVGLALTLADTTVSAGSYGSSTEIPTFTVDSKGRLTAAGTASVGTALTVAGDSGSEVIDLLSETLTIAGGTNLTSSAASDTITVNLDDNISLDSVTATGIITATELHLGNEGFAIQVKSDRITGPSSIVIDPAAVGDDTGLVVIKGDLQVDGTQTIINSTTVTVEDKNIQIADGAANDAAADGAGITVNSGDGNKTFQFSDTNDSFQANIALDVTSGNVYKVNGTEVLSADTLGSGVVNSSLTSVGTLGQLEVTGVTTSTGGFDGDLTGDVTGNADTATALETSRDFSISGDATASAVSFDGTTNVGLALTLADTTVSAGSYGSSTEIPTFTVDSKGRLTAAGTASVGTALTVAGDSGSEVIDLLSETLTIAGGTNLTSSAASDTITVNLDDNISLDSVTATGIITATGGFDGDLTGNADTATALETSRDFSISGDLVSNTISFDGGGNVSFASTLSNSFNANTSGIITASAFVGDGSGLTGAGSTVFNDTTTNQEFYLTFTDITSGTLTSTGISTSKLSYNPFSGKVTAVNYNTTSDQSLKTNIQTVDHALDIVSNLRGVSFDWKETYQSSYGVIAQELEQVLPDLVGNDDIKTVNYNGIIGILIEAIKELKNEIDILKSINN